MDEKSRAEKDTPQVVIRRPQAADKEARLACGRDPEEVRMYGGDYRNLVPLTHQDVDRWYEAVDSNPLAWMIEAEGQCVGHARLHQLDEADRSARYAVGIFNREYWNRGVGTAATRLVLQHAFEVLKLHRVELRTLSYNQWAIRCFEKCGFVQEGVERDSALIAGEWHSDIRMSILEDEYRNLSPLWAEQS